jgi:hypothetical protein
LAGEPANPLGPPNFCFPRTNLLRCPKYLALAPPTISAYSTGRVEISEAADTETSPRSTAWTSSGAPYSITSPARATLRGGFLTVGYAALKSFYCLYAGFCRLLRTRHERPSRRTIEQRDEFAAIQLIELHSMAASQTDYMISN